MINLDLNVSYLSYLYSRNVGALQGLHGIGARMSFLHAKICLKPQTCQQRGCHQSSRKKRIDWIPCYKSVLQKILDNDDNVQSSGAISPSTFSNVFETRNEKHGSISSTPKKADKMLCSKPSTCQNHALGTGATLGGIL